MGSGSGSSLKPPGRQKTNSKQAGASETHTHGRSSADSFRKLTVFLFSHSAVMLRQLPKQKEWALEMRAIKSIERLVPVSSTRHRAYTPGLSTWSSSTALIGSTRFEVGFPLRCLQRLSRPYIAMLHCGWRHNSSTRGTSIPVLSY